MSTPRLRAGRSLIIALVAIAGAAGDAQTPRRATAATVRGRVVGADGGPVASARLRIATAGWSIRSDIDGSFAIDLPPTGTLVVSKSGFVTEERTLPLAAGASEIRLTPAAAIAGRVANEYGEPIVDATVIAVIDGGRLTAGPKAATDDRGEYRIGGLAAGVYRVAVQSAGTEPLVTPALLATLPNGPTPIAGLGQNTFTTYYPATSDPGTATQVPLAAGDERGDVNVLVPNARAERQPLMVTGPIPFAIDQRPPVGEGGVIRGMVIDPQGRPLPFAQITLDGNTFSAPGNAPAPLSVYTTLPVDARGAFEFAGLRPGSYAIRAAKPGYSQSLDPAFISPRITITARESHEQQVILLPWGVVSGRLRDEYGDPVQGARISLLQSRYERGRRRMVEAPVGARVTNDRGEFRLFAIRPGDYIVRAAVAAGTAPELVDYPPAFYPGTMSGADARPVSIELGGELSGLDFALVGTPTVRVTGSARDSSGSPTTQLRVTLESTVGVSMSLDARIETDGTFIFDNVPPGQYVLKADAGRTNGYTEGEFMAQPLSVGQNDITGVRLQAATGSTITGTFVFDRLMRRTDPPPTSVRIAAVPEDFDLAPMYFASTQANAEGVFQLRGVTGRRRLIVTRTPARYMVKAILVNGRDVTDEALAFGRATQSLDAVEVVLTDRVSQLDASVTDGRAPVGAAHVLVFSTDRAHWYQESQRVLHQVTSAEGRVQFSGIPAGTYFAAALPSIPSSDDWRDPAFLDSIRPMATVTSVGDGQTEAIEIRVSRP